MMTPDPNDQMKLNDKDTVFILKAVIVIIVFAVVLTVLCLNV